MFSLVTPVIDYSVRSLCKKPYPGQSNGCPNFNCKNGCPPNAPLFDKIFDLSDSIFVIYNIFDLDSHIKRMKKLHPEWTDKQAGCSRYWQTTARKQLSSEINRFMLEHRSEKNLYYAVTPYNGIEKDLLLSHRAIFSPPEAMGVDLDATMRNLGIVLEWPPVTKTYQIALAGTKKEAKK